MLEIGRQGTVREMPPFSSLNMPPEHDSNNGFARKLASSDKRTREKAVALLVLWLSCQQDIGEEELKRIWKGLFYCVWHSDKTPVQAELVEKLASLLERLDVDLSLMFFKVFLSTMRREWSGIDKLRLDKFYLLLRKFLYHMFKVLEKAEWKDETVNGFMNALEERAFLAQDRYPALGINLHFTDIFLEEFRKFLPVPAGTLGLVLEPFYLTLSTTSDKSLLKRVRESVFDSLLTEARCLVKRVEENKDNLGSELESLGYLLLSTPVVTRLFELASSPATINANRKILYDLHGDFSKVAKHMVAFEVVSPKALDNEGANMLSIVEFTSTGSFDAAEELGQALSVKVLDSAPGLSSRKMKMKRSEKSGQPPTLGTGLHAGDRGDVIEQEFPSNENLDDNIPTENVKKPMRPTRSLESSFQGKGSKERKTKRKRSSAVGILEAISNASDNEQAELGLTSMSNCDSEEIIPIDSPNKFKKVAFTPDARVTRSKKKRKEKKSPESPSAMDDDDDNDNTGVDFGGCDEMTPSDSAKKVKRVRFELWNNLVWKKGPFPPLNLRTPPSATPRGSALKPGWAPSPIRTRALRLTRWAGVQRRKRVSQQYVSTSPRTSPRSSKQFGSGSPRKSTRASRGKNRSRSSYS